MSDLVERLREYFSGGIGYEAADRITELEAEVERLKSMVNDMARWEAIAASYRDECDDERKRAETAEAAWNTTETALRTLIDECTNETGEWSRMPRFWVIKKARATLTDGEDG